MATRVRDAMVRSVKGSHFLIATERTHIHTRTHIHPRTRLLYVLLTERARCLLRETAFEKSICSVAEWLRQSRVQACPWKEL